MLAGNMECCVPILVLQLQTGTFLHQVLHHVCEVQVGGQVQRALKITREKLTSVMHSELHGSD